MKKILSIMFCVAMLIGMTVVRSEAQTQAAIRVKGADSMFGRIMSLSKLYMKDHPDVEITVERNALVEEGMQALINGQAEVAMASRKITDQESEAAKSKGIKLVEHLIGYGGIVVITHPSTTIGEITIDQLKRLLKGDCTNWKEIGAQDQSVVVLKTGDKHPGTLLFVQNSILGGASIAASAQAVPDFPTMMQKVAETPGAIAYTRIRDPFESQAGKEAKIKALKIKKDDFSPPVNPSRATVLDGSYPVKRPYFLYTSDTADKKIGGFVDFVVSKGWGGENLTYMWQ